MSKQQKIDGYKIGDTVEWESQAQGSTTKKRGEIIKEVRPNHQPVYPSELKPMFDGRSREYISWLVKVGKRVYWPYPGKLKKVG